jgi:hypothetical protein
VQKENTKATSAALNAQVKKAENAYKISSETFEHYQDEKEFYETKDWESQNLNNQYSQAQTEVEKTRLDLEASKKRKEEVTNAKKNIGSIYHPYNLETGQEQTAAEVALLLESEINSIKEVSAIANLSENSQKRLEKAHRVLPKFTAILSFFWMTISFNFLGFTCYWGNGKTGFWRLMYTSRKGRFATKLKSMKEFLWKELNTQDEDKLIKSVLRVVNGWVNYHAISDIW